MNFLLEVLNKIISKGINLVQVVQHGTSLY